MDRKNERVKTNERYYYSQLLDIVLYNIFDDPIQEFGPYWTDTTKMKIKQ